jgi:hypothetical protein
MCFRLLALASSSQCADVVRLPVMSSQMRLMIVMAMLLAPRFAHASPPGAMWPEATPRGSTPRSADATSERFAIAVNEPFFWAAKIIGVSAYVGLATHHAIRANVASYPALGTQLTTVIAAPSGGSAGDRGRYFDVGAGWQWYPRELWYGPMFELGAVWRSDTTSRFDSADQRDYSEIERDAQVFVVRGLAGWTWLFEGRLFIMAAVGGSVGYAHGTELVRFDDIPMMTTRRVAPGVAAPEGYLRFGCTF